MIFVTIMVFLFGLAHSTVIWSDLPDFYLNSSISSSNVRMALRYAAFLDPVLAKENLAALGDKCNEVNANLGSLLTREEQVAIYCYTLDTILYKRVNYALRALNEPLLTAYTPYLKVSFQYDFLFIFNRICLLQSSFIVVLQNCHGTMKLC
jgi:hypothetical protein